jgi:hypothetical protein
MIKTRQDVKNVLKLTGVWRADITESVIGGILIITVPKFCNTKHLQYQLHRHLPVDVMLIVIKSNKNFIKGRRKYTYKWRVV